MSNPKLEIYKLLKLKGLIKNEMPEFEELLKEEGGKEEFQEWKSELPEKEQEEFDFIFGKG